MATPFKETTETPVVDPSIEVAEVPGQLDVAEVESVPEPKIPETTPPPTGEDLVASTTDLQAQRQKEVDRLTKQAETQAKTGTALVDELKGALETQESRAGALIAKEDELGVSTGLKQVAELDAQIQQSTAAFNKGLVDIQGKPIARQFITGQQAQLRAQAAAEIGALSAASSAAQGRVGLASTLAQRAIDAEFAPKEQRISTLKTLIDLNFSQLSATEQKRATELSAKLKQEEIQLNKEKADKQSIFDTMQSAAQNGADAATISNIMRSETPEEAIINAAEFVSTPDTKVIDVGGKKKLINSKTGETIKDLGVSDEDTPKPQQIGTDDFGNKIFGIFNPETSSFDVISTTNSNVMTETQLDSSVTQALSGMKFGSVDAAQTARGDIRRLLSQGNVEEAKDLLKRFARNSASATKLSEIEGKEDLVSTLDNIQEDLQEFVAKGGDLGIFTGLKEKALEKGGLTDDPKLTEISNRISIAIIDYRKAVSGAAFTESEQRAYDRVFPSTGKTLELNDAKINSLKEVAGGQVENFYKRRIGEGNWDSLFGTTRTTPQLTPLIQTYRTVDDLLKTQPEYQPLYEDILTADPSLTEDEVLSKITEFAFDAPTPSFSQPLGTGVNGQLTPQPKEELTKLKNGQTTLATMGGGTVTGIDGSPAWKHGLDFVLAKGFRAPVVAPFSGIVKSVVSEFSNTTGKPLTKKRGKSQNRGFGNQVVIQLPSGETIDVSHLEDVQNLKPGQRIEKGQPIGTQGNTGITLGRTGVHLDLTMKKPNGKFFTPREVASLLGDTRLT